MADITTDPVVPKVMPTDRVPDAIMFPASYLSRPSAGDHMAALKAVFSPILGNPPAVYFNRNGTSTFCHARQFESLNFATYSAKAGLPRFDWFVRDPASKDGVSYGFKVEGADDVE